MKEKVNELLVSLGLELTDENHKIVGEWTKRWLRVVQSIYELDPLLIGQDKKKQFEYQVTKSCLDMGRLALLNFGHIQKEPSGLNNKNDVYKPQFLVWDMNDETPQTLEKI